MKRRGFTLIELLVVVAIIALLIAILLPSLGKARELSNRSVCAANLRGIAQSLVVYSEGNDQYFPVLSTNGSSTVAAGGNNSSINGMFLLVKSDAPGSGQVAPKSFICKSDPANVSPAQTTSTGNPTVVWPTNPGATSPDFDYSYSFAYPWSGGAVGGYWRNTTDAALPISADMNPGSSTGNTPTDPKNNSRTHQLDGQNVGYGDGHAEFQRTQACGEASSNPGQVWCIYATGSAQAGSNGSNPSTGAPTVPAGSPGSWSTILVPALQNNQQYTRQ